MVRDWFPEIEPLESGLLPTADGQRVYWERCGNPAGRPALYLHGGPGTGSRPNQRRFFDPELYHAVLIDQRGTGRSRPLVTEASHLQHNTTSHLIDDIERLREHLGFDQWTVVGMSWGSTLALAYAERHPRRVSALLLVGVTTTTRREVDWITQDMRRLFPAEWERFAGSVPDRLRGRRLVDAYAELLADPDPEIRDHAAMEWRAWEDVHVSLTPGAKPSPRYQDPELRLRFALLVTHYWRNSAFLEDEQLILNAHVLNGIPGILIHGLLDVSSPMETPWRLSRAWTSSELRILRDSGHGGGASWLDAVLRGMEDLGR